MPTWLPALCTLASTAALFGLRAPHHRRLKHAKVKERCPPLLDPPLVALVLLGLTVLPALWTFTPWLAAADRAGGPAALALGALAALLGLRLFHRSHVDLGPNWSTTLELHEGHTLVTQGVYRRLRHPMYAAFLLHALGQAVMLPNWVAGPTYLVAFALLVSARLGREEGMLRDAFGRAWDEYRASSARLLPGVW